MLERAGLISTTEHRKGKPLYIVPKGYEYLLPSEYRVSEEHVRYIAEGFRILSEYRPTLMSHEYLGARHDCATEG
jgi:hypothetical protein